MQKLEKRSDKFDLGRVFDQQRRFWWLVGGCDGQRVIGPYSGCGRAHIDGYRCFGSKFSVELLPTRSKDCAGAMVKSRLAKKA